MKDVASECDEMKTAVKMVRRKKKTKSKHRQTHIDIMINEKYYPVLINIC